MSKLGIRAVSSDVCTKCVRTMADAFQPWLPLAADFVAASPAHPYTGDEWHCHRRRRHTYAELGNTCRLSILLLRFASACKDTAYFVPIGMTILDDHVKNLMTAVATMSNAVKVATDGAATGPSRRMAPSDLAALMFVGQSPECGVSDVADALRLGLTTASSICDRLVKKGLLSRVRSEIDRRAIILTLSFEGVALFEDALSEAEATCRVMLAALNPDERLGFIQAMQKIGTELSKGITSSG